MQSNAYSLWRVRGVTFFLFALAAASLVYWALQGWVAGNSAGVSLVATASVPPLDSRAVARALGAGAVQVAGTAVAPAPVAGRRFVLQGVVADRSSSGAALISVDGKPAKPFRVGASVDGRLILQSVQGRRAVLAAGMDAPAEVTLDLPALGK
jgi:general secretion pathway protein C